MTMLCNNINKRPLKLIRMSAPGVECPEGVSRITRLVQTPGVSLEPMLAMQLHPIITTEGTARAKERGKTLETLLMGYLVLWAKEKEITIKCDIRRQGFEIDSKNYILVGAIRVHKLI